MVVLSTQDQFNHGQFIAKVYLAIAKLSQLSYFGVKNINNLIKRGEAALWHDD